MEGELATYNVTAKRAPSLIIQKKIFTLKVCYYLLPIYFWDRLRHLKLSFYNR